MLELPHGAAEIAGIAFRTADLHHRVAGQVRHEMFRHANRPHARTAAAMRNRERLVQVQVADVRADRRRARQPHLRVHVRAVHVDLAAELVDDGADLADALLEDAIRRWIRHHQRGERVLVLLRFRAQVVQLDVTGVVTRDDDHLQAGHTRAGGVRAVRRRRDQDDVALRVAAVAMVGADDHQTRELALRAGVRLQRHAGEPGDLAERAPRARRIPARSPAPARPERTDASC